MAHESYPPVFFYLSLGIILILGMIFFLVFSNKKPAPIPDVIPVPTAESLPVAKPDNSSWKE